MYSLNCVSGGFENEPTCGRPLGMRFDNDGYLIVCDAYLGLYKVNVATGDVHVLWPHTAPIDGELAKLFNAVVVASNGMIYFTHSSTRWDRRQFRFCLLEADMTGRYFDNELYMFVLCVCSKSDDCSVFKALFCFADSVKIYVTNDVRFKFSINYSW